MKCRMYLVKGMSCVEDTGLDFMHTVSPMWKPEPGRRQGKFVVFETLVPESLAFEKQPHQRFSNLLQVCLPSVHHILLNVGQARSTDK